MGCFVCPLCVSNTKQTITYRSPQVEDPSCLQHLFALSCTIMTQAWKVAARLQTDLNNRSPKDKGHHEKAASRLRAEVQDLAIAAKEEGDVVVIWALSKALRRARKSPKTAVQPFWPKMATVLPAPKKNARHGLRSSPTSSRIRSPLTRGRAYFRCSKRG